MSGMEPHPIYYLIPAAYMSVLVLIAGLMALGIVQAIQKAIAERRRKKNPPD